MSCSARSSAWRSRRSRRRSLPFRELLREHLGADPRELPTIAEDVPSWEHANLQLGLEALFGAEGRTVTLVGIAGCQKRFMALSLSDLVDEVHFRPIPAG